MRGAVTPTHLPNVVLQSELLNISYSVGFHTATRLPRLQFIRAFHHHDLNPSNGSFANLPQFGISNLDIRINDTILLDCWWLALVHKNTAGGDTCLRSYSDFCDLEPDFVSEANKRSAMTLSMLA
jgi:hypothetical protein